MVRVAGGLLGEAALIMLQYDKAQASWYCTGPSSHVNLRVCTCQNEAYASYLHHEVSHIELCGCEPCCSCSRGGGLIKQGLKPELVQDSLQEHKRTDIAHVQVLHIEVDFSRCNFVLADMRHR